MLSLRLLTLHRTRFSGHLRPPCAGCNLQEVLQLKEIHTAFQPVDVARAGTVTSAAALARIAARP